MAALVIGAGAGYTFYAHRQQERKAAAIAAAAPKHTYAELQPLLDNRCFGTKTANEQEEWVRRIDVLPKADFKKTIDDLDAINATEGQWNVGFVCFQWFEWARVGWKGALSGPFGLGWAQNGNLDGNPEKFSSLDSQRRPKVVSGSPLRIPVLQLG